MASKRNSKVEALAALGKALAELDSVNLSTKDYGVAAQGIMQAIEIIRKEAN